jgi:hypothetical protein
MAVAGVAGMDLCTTRVISLYGTDTKQKGATGSFRLPLCYRSEVEIVSRPPYLFIAMKIVLPLRRIRKR